MHDTCRTPDHQPSSCGRILQNTLTPTSTVGGKSGICLSTGERVQYRRVVCRLCSCCRRRDAIWLEGTAVFVWLPSRASIAPTNSAASAKSALARDPPHSGGSSHFPESTASRSTSGATCSPPLPLVFNSLTITAATISAPPSSASAGRRSPAMRPTSPAHTGSPA